MRQFAQFFHRSTGYVQGSIPPRFDGPKTLIEACGSDSVLPLDGRLGLMSAIAEARTTALKRGFPAFEIRFGSTYSSGKPATQLLAADTSTPLLSNA